jgi:hypothetical protein
MSLSESNRREGIHSNFSAKEDDTRPVLLWLLGMPIPIISCSICSMFAPQAVRAP